MNFKGILLAAGFGSRFGGGKMTAKLPGGESMGLKSLEVLSKVVKDCLVVVRAGDKATADMYKKVGANICVCENSHLGISYSLIKGIENSGKCSGWIISLGDMPFIKTETVRIVLDALFADAVLVIPKYKSRTGHPVGISSKLRSDIIQLKGDVGAKPLFAKYKEKMRILPVNDPGILMDIDTKNELSEL